MKTRARVFSALFIVATALWVIGVLCFSPLRPAAWRAGAAAMSGQM